MYFLHQVFPTPIISLTFYSTAICGFILQIVFYYKRYDIRNALNQLCKLFDTLNQRGVIGNKYFYLQLTILFVSGAAMISALNVFVFHSEYERIRREVIFPFYVPSEIHDLCLGLVLLSSIFSSILGGLTCCFTTLLCDQIYLMTGNLIRSYRVNLKRNLKTGRLSTFILYEMKSLKAIVSLVDGIDGAFNLCSLLQYCALSTLIFITITVALYKETTVRFSWMNYVMGLNFVSTAYAFWRITLSGSMICDESELLKKISVQCSDEIYKQSIIGSNVKDGTLQALSLLLNNIRDVPLQVTGGGMFVISKNIFLVMTNSLVTYSIIMYQFS
ncbi:hypothetical protein HNY73_003742 [Argiope bruennichi]|uniref:Gustatory receptor n=1 Tax=Argiope bruennichi TaxID=94029 RepID=A0A8T0FMG1_ARGBR|nr:hypothetical protein HNY73_003742 [Argiope bruennichi]